MGLPPRKNVANFRNVADFHIDLRVNYGSSA